MPQVSVIIPTRNRPNQLPHAVASAKAAGNDVEVIVVDDASEDETAAVCKKLSGIKYVRLDRNQGVAGARNIGILASSSEYIAFLDDDNLRLPGSLDRQCDQLAANRKTGFVCGALTIVDQNYLATGETLLSPHTGDVFWPILELDFNNTLLTVVIRRECFLRVGLFKKRLSGIDDWDMLARIAELYPAHVTSEPVGLYRKSNASSDQGSSGQARQVIAVLQHQRSLFKLPRARSAPAQKLRAVRRKTINRVADTLLSNAAYCFPRGEFRFAFENLVTALRVNPMRAARPGAYWNLWRRGLAAPGTNTNVPAELTQPVVSPE